MWNLLVIMFCSEEFFLHMGNEGNCTIQNRNVHISGLNGALWDMGEVRCGICEIGLLCQHSSCTIVPFADTSALIDNFHVP